jgi:hypothetical protein
MKLENILSAKKETIRFLKTVTDLENEIKHSKDPNYTNFPKQQGALRRASMDLTRALAKMRSPYL